MSVANWMAKHPKVVEIFDLFKRWRFHDPSAYRLYKTISSTLHSKVKRVLTNPLHSQSFNSEHSQQYWNINETLANWRLGYHIDSARQPHSSSSFMVIASAAGVLNLIKLLVLSCCLCNAAIKNPFALLLILVVVLLWDREFLSFVVSFWGHVSQPWHTKFKCLDGVT